LLVAPDWLRRLASVTRPCLVQLGHELRGGLQRTGLLAHRVLGDDPPAPDAGDRGIHRHSAEQRLAGGVVTDPDQRVEVGARNPVDGILLRASAEGHQKGEESKPWHGGEIRTSTTARAEAGRRVGSRM
jgi:hypothetical protein